MILQDLRINLEPAKIGTYYIKSSVSYRN